MRLSAGRLLAIWIASFVSVAAAVVASGKFESATESGNIPFGTALMDLVGPIGSTRFVIFANVYLVVVLGIYAFDRVRGKVDVETHARNLRLNAPEGTAASAG